MMSYSVRTNTEEVIEVEENIIAFEEVQVAVLDCRSGRPLANKKVKRIVVKQDDVAIIDVKFDRTVNHALTIELKDALKGLGFNDAEVKKGYKKYWEARDSSAKAADAAGEPFPVFEARVIDEYKRHRATDDNGILTLQLPRVFFNGHSISVEVGFWDFPVFLEAVNDDPRVQDLAPEPIRRDGVDIGGSVLLTDLGYNGTKFDIVWTGREQSTDWNGNWGWEARRVSRNAAPIAPASGGMVSATYFLNSIGLNAGAGNQEVDMATEFKVSETIILKNNQAEVNMKAAQNVSILDSSLFSMFYVKGTNNSPFVLYGMQWCQPVWDGIEDPDSDNNVRSNDFAFVNMKQGNEWVRGLNMHIPSKHNGGSGPYYGICDTISPYPRGNHHEGVDLYSGPTGDNFAFAVHAGKLKSHSGSGYGYRAYLLFGGVGDPCFHYAHLQSSITEKDWVMAGEIVGTSGRTKTVSENYANHEPSHLHLEFIASATCTNPPIGGAKAPFSDVVDINPSANNPYSAPTGANAFLFQGNRLPLLLPCQCHFGSAQSVSQCRVGNGTNTGYKTCYAIQRYPYENNLLLANITDMVSDDLHPDSGVIRYICPHILGVNSGKDVQLQAKIKFLLVNKDRINPPLFPHAPEENGTFNSLITVNASNFSIDGSIGNGTKVALRQLIKAYFYCTNSDKEDSERILADDNAKISNVKIDAFINKYKNNTPISIDEDYGIVNDFYNWFTDQNQVDFSNMCWNAPL